MSLRRRTGVDPALSGVSLPAAAAAAPDRASPSSRPAGCADAADSDADSGLGGRPVPASGSADCRLARRAAIGVVVSIDTPSRAAMVRAARLAASSL